MATTPITPVALAINTGSGDLVAAGTVASTPADGWVIAAPVGVFTGSKAPHDALLLLFEADGSGDTVVILPAMAGGRL